MEEMILLGTESEDFWSSRPALLSLGCRKAEHNDGRERHPVRRDKGKMQHQEQAPGNYFL